MLGAGVLFGTTGTAQALGPDGMDPLSVGAVRQVSGGLVLALVGIIAWARREGTRRPRPSVKVGWVLLGGASIMTFQATFFAGTRANGVAVGTVVALGSSPLFAGLFEWLAGRPPSRRWLVATLVAVAGLVLLSGALGSTSAPDPFGLVLSIVAGASYAAYAVAAATLLRQGTHALIATTAILGTSGVIAAAILPFVDTGWLAEPPGLAMAFWLGPVTVVAAYLLMGTAPAHPVRFDRGHPGTGRADHRGHPGRRGARREADGNAVGRPCCCAGRRTDRRDPWPNPGGGA